MYFQTVFDMTYIRLGVPEPDKIAALIDKIPQVAAHTFRAQAFSLISSDQRTYGVVVTGIDPKRETSVSRLKSLIRQGEFLSGDNSDQALVGRLLARNLRVNLGDELSVIGQGRDGSIAATVVKIKGIFSSGIDELDRASIHIPLHAFQEIFSMQDAVHAVVVITDSLSDVDEVKHAIQSDLASLNLTEPLAVLDWNELMPGLRQSIEMDLISGLIFYLLLLLVVAFSILNTFLMAIFERTREFGVLMASLVSLSLGRLAVLPRLACPPQPGGSTLGNEDPHIFLSCSATRMKR